MMNYRVASLVTVVSAVLILSCGQTHTHTHTHTHTLFYEHTQTRINASLLPRFVGVSDHSTANRLHLLTWVFEFPGIGLHDDSELMTYVTSGRSRVRRANTWSSLELHFTSLMTSDRVGDTPLARRILPPAAPVDTRALPSTSNL